jgi:hypothetical protein
MMRTALALFFLTLPAYGADPLLGTWQGGSGTLTITPAALTHTSMKYPAHWRIEGRRLYMEWDVGGRAILVQPIDCTYILAQDTLTLRDCALRGVYRR